MRMQRLPIKKCFLKWAGCKARLLKDLLPLLPEGKDRLIEPFVGSGALFMNTDFHNNLLADSNQELISLFALLKEDGPAVLNQCKALFTAQNNAKERYYDLRDE